MATPKFQAREPGIIPEVTVNGGALVAVALSVCALIVASMVALVQDWEAETDRQHAEVLSRTIPLVGTDRIRISVAETAVGNGTCVYLVETYSADEKGRFLSLPEKHVEVSFCP